ncbi:MAG: hypothetical protein JW941_11725, partial [Candidatus Coatesbacteria bacterium]|nr:hypothetical protein [Candidatus Coatesbacteria bacterium]
DGQLRLPVLASTGCKHNCLHCLVPKISGGVTHLRRPFALVKEMRSALLDLGERRFELIADNLTPPDLWWEELVEEMARAGLKTASFSFRSCDCTFSEQTIQKLKTAGCDMVFLVLPLNAERAASEFGYGPDRDADCRSRAIRLLHAAGIFTCLCFVAGLFPDDEDMVSAVKFARKSGANAIEFLDARMTSGSRSIDLLKRRRFGEGEVKRMGSMDRGDVVVSDILGAMRKFWLRPAPLLEMSKKFGPRALPRIAKMLLRPRYL